MPASKRKPRPSASSASVLRSISKFIAGLTQEQIDALAQGSLILSLTEPENNAGRTVVRRSDGVDYEAIMLRLSSAETTEIASGELREMQLTRAQLISLLRKLDVPILKQDNISRLEEKAVDALVGSRLNSQAVRGK